jgi:nitroreductase
MVEERRPKAGAETSWGGQVETWDAIGARRNVRAYEDRPIARTDLERILEAGRRSPSAANRQSWDFVVVTERGELQELSKVWQYGRHVASSAATVSLVAPAPADARDRDGTLYDLGQATMSMMLAAADLGIGSCHSSVGDQEQARKVLGFPDDRFCAYLVAFGYPADRPLVPIMHPNRRPFDEVVHWDHW